MSQNASQKQNRRSTLTSEQKLQEPISSVSSDDPVGVTSPETGKPPAPKPVP